MMVEGIRTLSVEFLFHGWIIKIINSTNRFQVGQARWLWKVHLLSSELCTHLERFQTAVTQESRALKYWAALTFMSPPSGIGGGGPEVICVEVSLQLFLLSVMAAKSHAGGTRAFQCWHFLVESRNCDLNSLSLTDTVQGCDRCRWKALIQQADGPP